MKQFIGGLAGGGAWVPVGLAAPHPPSDDGAVLERLPLRRADPAAAELRKLRAAASARANDPAAAAALARRYFELAMAQGDPRYVGYAEGALLPWKGGDDAPAEVLSCAACSSSTGTTFRGALRDLEATLRRDAEHIGARSWRAAIFMVGADYAAARAECLALEPVASELLATGCRAAVDAATGKARAAYDDLKAELERRPDAAPEIRLWVLTRLAEFAWRLGEIALAERHFRDALALGERDDFLLAAYADSCSSSSAPKRSRRCCRNGDSPTICCCASPWRQGIERSPGAEIRAGARRALAAAALRGERLHLAEEARYLLELKGDPKAALAAAAENWKSQREPRDAAVLLEAALAARDPRRPRRRCAGSTRAGSRTRACANWRRNSNEAPFSAARFAGLQ